MSYYSTTQMLHSLIDRVSKNGNMLLNISPMADGTIPQAQRSVLLGIGDWLRKFGQSIYATRAWTVYGEGPTKAGGGAFTAPLSGTNKDFRFTRTKDSSTLYAICLGWPGNGAQVTIASVTAARFAATGVYLLGDTPGTSTKINTFTQDSKGLTFTAPSTQPYTALAYAFKITSSRSVGTTIAPAVNNRRVSNNAGRLCLAGPLFRGMIKPRPEIAGVQIVSLRGEKIAGSMSHEGRQGDDYRQLSKNASPQVYYVKYLTQSKH